MRPEPWVAGQAARWAQSVSVVLVSLWPSVFLRAALLSLLLQEDYCKAPFHSTVIISTFQVATHVQRKNIKNASVAMWRW